MKRWLPLLLVSLVLASCSRQRETAAEVDVAASASPPLPAPASSAATLPRTTQPAIETLDLDGAIRELAMTEKQLGDAVALAAADCDVARVLRDRICELAARICNLTETSPQASIKEKCEDGKRRCDGAKDKVGARCP